MSYSFLIAVAARVTDRPADTCHQRLPAIAPKLSPAISGTISAEPSKERPGRDHPGRERPIRERPIRERPIRERAAKETDARGLDALEITDQLLGEGANGKVWSAHFGLRRSAVAAKVVKKANLDPRALGELHNEIELHKRLRHPNIVTLHGAFEDPTQVTIVLSLCRGGSLFDNMVRAHQEESGGLSEQRARDAFKQVLGALRHCHRNGIAHRDVCLRNLCWADEAETTLQLVDFGYATTAMHHATFVGSVHFAAPEVS